MILNRLGNKKTLLDKLTPLFPEHTTWIEPFFGSGGAFFYKPLAEKNILNDADEEVVNLFLTVIHNKEKLRKMFKQMPIHRGLFEHWKKNTEQDPILKALRFLLLSNYSFMSAKSTIRFYNGKKNFDELLDNCFNYIKDCYFYNTDFEKFLKDIDTIYNKSKAFIYCDPPYLDSASKQNAIYNMESSWKREDFIRLLDCLDKTGCKYGVSEFDNPFVLEVCSKRGLNVHIIGERQNLKNRRTEIFITNFKQQLSLF